MTPRARLALALIALLALVAVVYAPVRRGVFIGDDVPLVLGDPLVVAGTPREILTRPYAPVNPLTDSRPVYYRPLTVASLRADYAMASDDAPSFHMTNLFLHLCATAALLLAARRLGAPPLAALLAAAGWALLPRSTECVAWISGRADVLAAIFVLSAIALWPWLSHEESRGARRGAGARAVLASVAVLCGLLAKEVSVAAVLAIVTGTVLGAHGAGRERARTVLSRLAYLVPSVAAYIALRSIATRDAASRISPIGPWPRAATALETVGRYLEMTLDPWHPRTGIGFFGAIDTVSAALGATLLVACGAVAVLARRRRPDATAPALGSAGVAIATSATLGIASLGLVVHVVPIVLVAAVAADRLLYLPLAALVMCLAVTATKLSRRNAAIAAGAAVLVTASFIPVTRARADDYTNDLRFRVAAAEAAHRWNTGPKSTLANVVRSKAELDLACRLHASAVRALAEMGPAGTVRHARALENLGSCYAVLGNYDGAAEVYRKLLQARPDNPRIHMAIGFLSMHALALDRAEASLGHALALDPSLDAARSALDSLPGTRRELARLSSDDARRADRLGWAALLTRVGRTPEATRAWTELALDPSVPNGTAVRAVDFLLTNGDIATARLAAEAYVQRAALDERMVRERFAKRASDQVTIDALRPRLEALAAK